MSRLKEVFASRDDYPESDGKPMGETDSHIALIIDLKFALTNFFAKKKDVYVSGNIMMYYVEGDPNKVVSPDVLVVRGVRKGKRRTYKVWEEGRAPDVVIEVSSRKTWKEDFNKKMNLYAELGVKEYYIFDPEYTRARKPFSAYRLNGNRYVELLVSGGKVKSEALGLEIVDTGETLRLFNPKTKKFLLTEEEAAQALFVAEREIRAEVKARMKAEAELARLRQELERLKQQKR